MFRPHSRQYDRYSGVQPALDYNIVDQTKIYNGYNYANQHMGSHFQLPPPIEEPKELKVAPPTIAPVKEKKRRKTSIEGETVKELTDNIILDKPTLKLVVKAFKKMAEIVQEEKDNEIFNGE